MSRLHVALLSIILCGCGAPTVEQTATTSREGAVVKSPELILDRFCGRETYPIKSATWNLYTDDELQMSTLCLSVEAGPGTILHEDTKSLNAEPSWEVNVVEMNLPLSALAAGAVFHVPEGYDEARGGHVTNFYYCEHEGSDENIVEILAIDGERLLVRLQGETVDVNFYDGSKPATKLSVETWFVREQRTTRSMQ